ncbi:MAG: PEP-CTERM sorting domain-containing protein [bacterium]|nr:PEP-CTERM sorting domain-containing protein [bacterium]
MDANWTGIFTAQFTPQTYQQVIALLGTQGFVDTSYSATVTLSAIPEPATFGLIGMGLFCLGVTGFVRRKRNRQH